MGFGWRSARELIGTVITETHGLERAHHAATVLTFPCQALDGVLGRAVIESAGEAGKDRARLGSVPDFD